MSDDYRASVRAEELASAASRGAYRIILTSVVSLNCLLRGLPLFFSSTPKTPLRALCVIAFDTLHVLRYSKPLPHDRRKVLATFLDFAACTNATLDHKECCLEEYQSNLRRLENAGIRSSLAEFLRQLRELEGRRPSSWGDQRRFDEVRLYREAVAKLSLGIVAVIALGDECVADRNPVTHRDNDLEILFKIVMQCQIIDDMLDYAEDVAAGLPSFLTASASLQQSIELTAGAAHDYAKSCDSPQFAAVFPLRIALCVVSVITKLVIRVGHRMHERPGIRNSCGET